MKLVCLLALFMWVPLLGYAQQPSPAGGSYLDMSGDTYYFAQDAPSLDSLLGDEWTIEMWLYLREFPPRPVDRQNVTILFAKPGSYGIYLNSHFFFGGWWLTCTGIIGGKGGAHVLDLAANGDQVRPPDWQGGFIELGRWHYLVIQQSQDEVMGYFDGKLKSRELAPIPDTGVSLSVGGAHSRLHDEVLYWAWSHANDGGPYAINIIPLNGALDEIRISSVARYEENFVPNPGGRFENDRHTLALWHFDEPLGSLQYRDASGNDNTLMSSELLSVARRHSQRVTWAMVKREP